MERAQFLERIARALETPAPANHPHPVVRVHDVPAITYRRPIDDPVEAFVRAAGQVGSTVRRCATEGDVVALLEDVLVAGGVKSAVVSADPETTVVRDHLAGLGVDCVAFAGAETIAAVDLGVVGAVWGLAATGTTVFDASRAGGRTASLLPPTILVLVRADAILHQASDLFRAMATRWPEGPPSQLVLASGPSRTGDIELVLTMGVHGPKAVWVGVLEGDQRAAP